MNNERIGGIMRALAMDIYLPAMKVFLRKEKRAYTSSDE